MESLKKYSMEFRRTEMDQIKTSVAANRKNWLDEFAETKETISKGKIVSDALAFWLKTGKLATLRRELERQVSNAGYPVPVPVAPSPKSNTQKNKFSVVTYNNSFDHDMTATTHVNVPGDAKQKVIDMPHTQSKTLSDALESYEFLTRIIGDRFDYLTLLSQIVQLASGQSPSGELNQFLQRRRDRVVLPIEAELEARQYESLFDEFGDINNIPLDSDVTLSREEVNAGDILQGATRRGAVLAAVMRDEGGTWSVDEARELSESLFDDIGTKSIHENYARKAVKHVGAGFSILEMKTEFEARVEAAYQDALRDLPDRAQSAFKSRYGAGVSDYTQAEYILSETYETPEDAARDIVDQVVELLEVTDTSHPHAFDDRRHARDAFARLRGLVFEQDKELVEAVESEWVKVSDKYDVEFLV